MLTQLQTNALHNVIAASDGVKDWKGHEWCKTSDLSGDHRERSSATLKSLVPLGMIEKKRWGSNRQARHSWRPTEAGRKWAETHPYRYTYN